MTESRFPKERVKAIVRSCDGVSEVELMCAKCGALGKVERFSFSDVDDYYSMPDGWLVQIGIDSGYEHGDEKVEIEESDNHYCSFDCLEAGIVEYRKLRAEQEARDAARRRAEFEQSKQQQADLVILAVYGRDALVALKAAQLEALKAMKERKE